MAPPRITAAEETETKKDAGKEPRKKWVTPNALSVANKVLRLLDGMNRRDQVNVVNIVMTHFGLNEPPQTPPA